MSTLHRVPNFYRIVPFLLVLLHGKIGFSQNLPSLLTNASEFEKKSVRFVSSAASHAAGANSEYLPADLRQSIRDVYVWAWPMIYMTNAYAPSQSIVEGDWNPPAAVEIEDSGIANTFDLASAASKTGT